VPGPSRPPAGEKRGSPVAVCVLLAAVLARLSTTGRWGACPRVRPGDQHTDAGGAGRSSWPVTSAGRSWRCSTRSPFQHAVDRRARQTHRPGDGRDLLALGLEPSDRLFLFGSDLEPLPGSRGSPELDPALPGGGAPGGDPLGANLGDARAFAISRLAGVLKSSPSLRLTRLTLRPVRSSNSAVSPWAVRPTTALVHGPPRLSTECHNILLADVTAQPTRGLT
jgi:hypothetical protein